MADYNYKIPNKNAVMKRSVILVTGLLWILLSSTLRAEQIDDIRIVIDVSGSMQKTDPNNLRAPALRMLNGLIPTGSKAGVWTFGRYVNMEVKWGRVDKAWRELADHGADRIHSRGQYTNIESALERASTGWGKADPSTRRNLILLTDGKVDVSRDAEKNAQSRTNVLDKSLPELIRQGVKVHAIALSDQTDETLLKSLALKTQGSFEVAKTADDLQRIFLRMFERAVKPDTVPLNDNKFTIDGSISELTLLAFRKTDKESILVQPDGVRHSESKHAGNVKWRFEKGYDLVTVSKPVAGVWVLDSEQDDDNRVMIVTDLKLQVDELPAYSTPDKALDIKLELHNKNEKITKNSFLKFVNFSLLHKVSGSETSLDLKARESLDINDKGIYLQRLEAPLAEGEHEILVNVDARTFSRSKRINVQVQWPVMVEISKTERAGQYRLDVRAREEYIKAETLSLVLRLETPSGTLRPIDVELVENRYTGLVSANTEFGLHRLLVSMQAESVEGELVQHDLGGYSLVGVRDEVKASTPEPEKNPVTTPAQIVQEEEVDSGDYSALIYIGLANLMLVLIALGVYFFWKRRSATDEVDLFDPNEIETEGMVTNKSKAEEIEKDEDLING